MVASHCGGNSGWLVESGVEESRDSARIREQKLGSPLEVRVVHCSQTQQPVCTQASEGALNNPKRLKLSARGSKFTSATDLVEKSLAEESETCVWDRSFTYDE